MFSQINIIICILNHNNLFLPVGIHMFQGILCSYNIDFLNNFRIGTIWTKLALDEKTSEQI